MAIQRTTDSGALTPTEMDIPMMVAMRSQRKVSTWMLMETDLEIIGRFEAGCLSDTHGTSIYDRMVVLTPTMTVFQPR